MISEALKQAYLTTSYEVSSPQGTITLRIGVPNPILDQLLHACGCDRWAFITASNPASKPLPAVENEQRHWELCERVAKLGYQTLEGVGKGADEQWPPEKSLLVMGIERETASELGKHFGQYGIVVGHINQAPELLLLE